MRPDGSLGHAYFEGIFASDADPWGLESSAYEQAKFDRTIAALADRRYGSALEIGCAQGVLTRRLAGLCDALLGLDISATALQRAAARCGDLPQVALARLAYPQETPEGRFDLIILSEVAYYWDDADLARAAHHIAASLETGGRLILVHFTGETDYPHSGDDAVAKLRVPLAADVEIERAERHERYRLDLWRRR